jgi:lipooligosaccharide transport system permease protein
MSTETAVPVPVTPRPSTGRVVGPVHAAWLIVEGKWTWYRMSWRATIGSSVLMPLLFLVALGYGFGTQVKAGAATDGMRYVVYLAPALLASAGVQNAASESTFPILSGFKWQKRFWGIAATPIAPSLMAAGELWWISMRLLLSGGLYLLVAVLLGAMSGPGTLLALVFSVLCGMALAGPLVAFSATIEREGQQFNNIFRFVVLPMTLFAGTFFPVSSLPVYLRPIAWLTPLWHGTELSRAAVFGRMQLWPVLGHTAYLLALFAIGAWLTARQFQRRLAV